MRDTIGNLQVGLRGAASGVLGTGLMTLVFVLLDRLLVGERTIAPSHPERMVGHFARRTGATEVAKPETRGEVATLAHFGYGALWGAIYGFVHQFLPIPLTLGSLALGLFIWAVGFVGWLPAMRHLPPPWRRSPGKVASGLISHLAYGLGTALAYHLISLPGRDAFREMTRETIPMPVRWPSSLFR